jgi:glycolate oxidase iron-sulfur subunit
MTHKIIDRGHNALQGFSGFDIPNFEILNTCVKCGLCLPTCPTYRATGREQSSPRGRIHLMQSVHEGRTDLLDPIFVEQAYECLDCRACEAVCPSGVQYGQVIEDSRAQIERARSEHKRQGLFERLLRSVVLGRLFTDLRLLRALATVLRFYQTTGLQQLARRTGLLRLLQLERLERQMPDMRAPFLVPSGQTFAALGERRGRVALLAGCVMQTAFADIDRATIRVLVRNGWEVIVPAGQQCCGALHIHAGELDPARGLARANITAFESASADYIVNNAAGCGAALKEYGRLLERDQAWGERAARFAEQVRDVTELLAMHPLRGPLAGRAMVATYQDPCHLLHAQKISTAPRTVLASLPGMSLVEMTDPGLCCGSAGIYSITHPEMSSRLLYDKLDHALETGAQVIATANAGCLLQLQAGLRMRGQQRSAGVRARHVVELVDDAYRAAEATGPGRL